MLALSRSARAVHSFSHHVRALSAVAPSTASPEIVGAGRSDVDSSGTDHQLEGLVKSSTECMFVYPWNGIRSSAEGLAVAKAVQDKYGRAKEVVFPRDLDSITVFHPYFWILFDDPEVRKRFPEESAQLRVRVADLQNRDCNVGIEEMLRALGLSTTSTDTDSPREPESPSVTEGTSTDTSDSNDGYKTIDIRVEWSRTGPGDPTVRRRPLPYLRYPDQLANFAAAWLAFDGFSPESARGPHTPNLLRARKKWQDIFAVHRDDLTIASPPSGSKEPEPQGAVEAATTTESSPEICKPGAPSLGPREWIPILPSSSRAHHPDRSTTTTATSPRTSPDHAIPASSDAAPSITATSTPDPVPADASTSTWTPMPTATTSSSASAVVNDEPQSPREPKPSSIPRSRRERILHLARQNARTPLPEHLVETIEKDQSGARNEGEQKLEAEAEQQGKERTIRERLWRLVGGNY